MSIVEVQTIACVNNGAFVMSFGLELLSNVSGWKAIPHLDSGNYPVNQVRSIDLSTVPGLSEGSPVRPQVRVVWGRTATPPANSYVLYVQNGLTATWTVTGTTLNVHVDQIGG